MFTIKFINYSTLFYFRRTRKHVFGQNIHHTYIGLDEPIFIPIPRRKVKHFPNLYSKVAKYIHFWYLLFKAYRCGRVSSTENELLKKVWEAYYKCSRNRRLNLFLDNLGTRSLTELRFNVLIVKKICDNN